MDTTERPSFNTVPSPREIEWRRILERWKQSELNGRAFCEREQLSLRLFYYWRRQIRLRDEGRRLKSSAPKARKTRFIPVRMTSQPTAPLEILLSDGHAIRVAADFDSKVLAKIIAVLEGGRC
jgi:hypothetical protein